jgi:hypothetical protein
LKVTNASGVMAIITGMSTTGDFAQTSTCGARLAALGTCTISITFKPTAAGKLSGSLTLNDDATNSPQLVKLSGKGNQD